MMQAEITPSAEAPSVSGRCGLPAWKAAILCLPSCLLLLVVVLYTISSLTGRMVLVEGSISALLLLPCLWLVVQPQVQVSDGVASWFVAGVLALELWMVGMQLLLPEALPAGWWCVMVRAAGLSTLVLMVGSHLDARALVRACGAAAACAVMVCACLNAHYGLLQPLCTDSFGFGHVNILTNTAGPSLFAWTVLTVLDWRAGQRPRPVDLALLLAGLAALGAITITTQRRGVLLAAGGAAAWLSIIWLWRVRRPLAIAALAAIGMALALGAVHLLTGGTPGLRAERLNLYRSGMEGVVAGLPWGFGYYGALHLQTVAGEACRHTIATGGYGDDIHNQFIEAALDGGVVAMALLLGLIALIARRLLAIKDPALRPALQALGVAILMHMITDNVYGTEVGVMWLSVALGTMLTASCQPMGLPALRWLPPLRYLAWPLAVVAAAGAAINLRPALLSEAAGAQSSYRCLEHVLAPQSVWLYTERIVQSDDPWADRARRLEALAMSVHTTGWTLRMAAYQIEFASQEGNPEKTVAAILRVLALNPFFKEIYQQLATVLAAHPACIRLVPDAVRLRLAYLEGEAHLPRPDLHHRALGIDEAADLYAAIIWSFANDVPWTQIDAPLHDLCRRYGDIQGVSQLVVMAQCFQPAMAIPWMAEVAPVLRVGLRTPGAMIAAFSVAQNAAQARALLPLIELIAPGVIAELDNNTMHRVEDPLAIVLRTCIVRLWGLARSGRSKEGAR